MRILISGSTGFVGTPLVKFLKEKNHEVFELVRHRGDDEHKILWNIEKGFIDVSKISNIDAVINLSGENIAQARWNEEVKKKIWDSRVNGTRLLQNVLKDLGEKPKIWINASAVGYYGRSSNKLNLEASPPEKNFLAQLCSEWEKEANKASDFCDRVVILRFGMILDKRGGALGKMLPIFKKGLGGPIGFGKQYLCWVALIDVIHTIDFALNNEISGTFNTVSPGMVTNKEFTKILSKAIHKPAFLPVPRFVLKIIFGEMANDVLLSDLKASPLKLMGAGYRFKEKNLEYYLTSHFQGKTND